MTKKKKTEDCSHMNGVGKQGDKGPDIKLVYTVAEAAKILTLSNSTVRRLIKHDLLRAVNTHGSGGRVLISYQALQEFLGERASA